MYDVVEQVVDDVKDGSRGTRRRYDGEEEESEGGQLGVERESGAHDGKMKLVWWGNERGDGIAEASYECESGDRKESALARRRCKRKMVKGEFRPSK
jgi:hypothetical protein